MFKLDDGILKLLQHFHQYLSILHNYFNNYFDFNKIIFRIAFS